MFIYCGDREQNPDFHLSEQAFNHAIGSLRKQSGDSLLVAFSEKDSPSLVLYKATIGEIDRKRRVAVLEVHSSLEKSGWPHYPARQIHLIAAAFLPDRLEWMLEKATELGISGVT